MSLTLVTGCAGFIGFHLAEYLLRAGQPVVGIDNLNQYYDPALKQARLARLQAQAGFTFERMDVADYEVGHDQQQKADLVLAVGILHHLDDAHARALMRTAFAALKPGGRFISLDGAYVDGQSAIARALISRDRGQSIRTPAAYHAIAAAEFGTVDGQVRTDLLFVPYTHYIMECVR